MKDYIVTTTKTITSSHFDATKFDFNKFYIVEGCGISHRCLLKKVGPEEASFVTIIDGEPSPVVVNPYEISKGEVVIKEVADVPMCNETFGVFEFKDLYHNKCKIKTSKCYELKIAGYTYRGFCSKRNKDNITMVLFSGAAEIGVIYRDPTMIRSWEDNVKYIHFPGDMSVIENSITNGTVMTIDLNEIIEDSILFREMI